MFIVIFVVALSTAMILHELGHAWELKKRGMVVEEIGLGMPLPWMHVAFYLPAWPKTKFCISPLLFMAYVKVSDEQTKEIESLSYWDQSLF